MEQSKIIKELQIIADLVQGSKQERYYRRMIKDARLIKVVKLSEIFSKTEIERIKTLINPKPKDCYRNATLLAKLIPDAKYVEGKMTVCGIFGTEHAWNKIGDNYIDITMELALERNPIDEEYVMLGEYNADTVVRMCVESGFYGNIYQKLFIKNKENEQEI